MGLPATIKTTLYSELRQNFLHTAGVTGSIPVPPTIPWGLFRAHRFYVSERTMGKGPIACGVTPSSRLGLQHHIPPPNGQTLLAVVAECFEKFHGLIKGQIRAVEGVCIFPSETFFLRRTVWDSACSRNMENPTYSRRRLPESTRCEHLIAL